MTKFDKAINMQMKALEESTDFEKRYGSNYTYGKALEREQNIRNKLRIKLILKNRHKK